MTAVTGFHCLTPELRGKQNVLPCRRCSTIDKVLAELKSSSGPVTKVLHGNDYFKVLVIGMNTNVIFPDHTTKVPAKLTVLKGSVVYQDADGNTPLFQFDDLEIPRYKVHSLRAVRPSVCLLTMG